MKTYNIIFIQTLLNRSIPVADHMLAWSHVDDVAAAAGAADAIEDE